MLLKLFACFTPWRSKCKRISIAFIHFLWGKMPQIHLTKVFFKICIQMQIIVCRGERFFRSSQNMQSIVLWISICNIWNYWISQHRIFNRKLRIRPGSLFLRDFFFVESWRKDKRDPILKSIHRIATSKSRPKCNREKFQWKYTKWRV